MLAPGQGRYPSLVRGLEAPELLTIASEDEDNTADDTVL